MKSCFLLAGSLFLFAAACGDNLAGPDAAITPDAPVQPDAPIGEGPPALWFHGDAVEDNRFQVVRHLHGEALPLTPAVVLPGGDTAELPSDYGDGAYAPYDVNHDGTRVAFAANMNEDGRYDLYVANSDGTGVTVAVVMPAGAAVKRVRFSPNGELIAFRADYHQLGQDDVYVVPADAVEATPTRLSPDRAAPDMALDAHDMVWTGDSTRVIMTGEFTDDNYRELWISDATAATPAPTALVGRAQITSSNSGAKGAVGPVFMAATGKVLFKSRMDADNAYKLHQVSLDGGDLEILPSSQITRSADDSIAWVGAIGVSTGGDQIAFAADEVELAYEIFVMPIDGSAAPTRVTSGTAAVLSNPEVGAPLWWSADDSRIAFVADYALDNKYEPYVLSVDGGGEVKLAAIGDPATNVQDATELAWTPDGATLYMIADHEADNDYSLFTLDANATDQTPTLAYPVVTNGDIRGIRVTPSPAQ